MFCSALFPLYLHPLLLARRALKVMIRRTADGPLEQLPLSDGLRSIVVLNLQRWRPRSPLLMNDE